MFLSVLPRFSQDRCQPFQHDTCFEMGQVLRQQLLTTTTGALLDDFMIIAGADATTNA